MAWSTFLTGLDPGAHGIFDFIHRHPETIESFLSTSRTVPPGRMLTLGRWQFPLEGGRVELLRHGTPFWEVLEARGVETTIVRMPANFPPSGTATRELSGMGTPDMLGTYGIFTLFTSRPEVFERQNVSGGTIMPIDVIDGVARGSLEGPPNPYLVTPAPTTVAFEAHVDQAKSAVQIVIGGQSQVLRVGEWGDWLPVELPLAPMTTLPGEVRFLLKRLQPHFELYASPINLDPFAPALPISTPEAYAAELASAEGRFYTQGMPEDTRGMNAGALEADELLAQARITADENLRQFDYVLDGFRDGLLFYYFGHVDQVSHMMWRAMDPGHPAYTAADEKYRDVVAALYEQMDGVVGRTMAALGPDDLLVVMSDHGFAPWRRAMNLNSWLRDAGYLAVTNAQRRRPSPGLGRRGLDAHPGLRRRPERSLRQHPGPRGQGHRARRRTRGAGQGDRRTARGGDRSVDRAAGGHPGIPPRKGLRRPRPPRPVARHRRRLRPRHAGVERFGARHRRGRGLQRQPRGLERRSQHGPRPRAGRTLHQPAAEGARAGAAATGRVDPRRVRRDRLPRREADAVMFGSRIKLDKALLAKLKRYSDLAGYASVEEFITHALEKEIAQLEGAESEQELKKKLKGLGYLS